MKVGFYGFPFVFVSGASRSRALWGEKSGVCQQVQSQQHRQLVVVVVSCVDVVAFDINMI